ncbi:MAG: hypothetical protein QOG64_384 [Acidimicrobiaceae bacterium]|nr:hypothetical protein [Acidimicrobiaceae bacterium]
MLVLALLAGAAAFALAALLSVLAPGVLSMRRAPAVVAVATVFGVAALFSHAAPTGLKIVDTVLRVAFVFGCVFAARYARREAVAVAAALAIVASVGSPLQWLAFVGAGLVVSTVLVGSRASLAKAVEGGALGVVTLHLTWPSPRLTPSVVGIIVLAPVFVSGYRHFPRKMRRRVRRTGQALAVAAVAAGLLAAFGAAEARPRLERGIALSKEGLKAAREGQEDDASGRLSEASRSFSRAHNSLDAFWMRPADLIPVVSQHFRALRTMTASGARLGSVGGRALSLANPNSLRMDHGTVPVDRLAQLEKPISDASVALNVAHTELNRVRSPWLIGPVATRLSDLLTKVTQAQRDAKTALNAAQELPPLLGINGPRHYFLAVQTPSELRGTGGVMGNYGEVGTDHGRITLDRTGRTIDLNNGGDPNNRHLDAPEDYLRRYSGYDPEAVWQNLNVSPDFPTVAKVIGSLYPQSGGRPLDGVIAIDPIGLAKILSVLGPIQVPSWPTPITGDNAAHVLLFDQYVTFADKSDRVDFLGSVTDAVWRKFTTETPSLTRMAQALGQAVNEKHVLLSSMHDDEQRAFQRLGVAGAMAPVQQDYLGVVTLNEGGNKIDWFLKRAMDYRVHLDPRTGEVNATLDVRLQNLAPATGLPDYVIGDLSGPPRPVGTSALFLSLYTPLSVTAATLDGGKLFIESDTELGRHVFSKDVLVPAGATVTMHFDLHGSVDPNRDYRVDVLRQPTITPDDLSLSVSVPKGWKIAPAGGKKTQSFSEHMTQASDKTLILRSYPPKVN